MNAVINPPLVLVVDDDASARRLVRMGLELEGATVVEADTLARARQRLHRQMAGVVLDRELPDGDGLELLIDIGATCPDASVVVNSTLEDRREPASVRKVDKGDVAEIVRALALSPPACSDEHLAVVDLVRAEASVVVVEWEELCRWDPLLAPDSRPPLAGRVVDAIAEALQRPQPLGWGPDPALTAVMESFAIHAGAIDVCVGQLVCLREAFRRHLLGHVPPAEEGETMSRVDMIIDRAIWSAARVAAARMQRELSVDPLTGLGTRLALDADLADELQRTDRYHREVTVVALGVTGLEGGDLDPAGEAVIRRLAGLLVAGGRSQDSLYRIGPAAFALVAPETSSRGARALVERLRSRLGREVTCGSATAPVDGLDVVSVLRKAEERRGERSDSATAGGPSPR